MRPDLFARWEAAGDQEEELELGVLGICYCMLCCRESSEFRYQYVMSFWVNTFLQ